MSTPPDGLSLLLSIFSVSASSLPDHEYKDTFYRYEDILNKKRYEDLNYETCKNIDEYFEAVHELKRYVYGLEKKDDEWLQELGDNLRGTGNPFKEYTGEKFNNLDIISYHANRYIKYIRRRNDKKANNYFIIDSFRNPEEVNFFRKRYGTFFYVLYMLINQLGNKGSKRSQSIFLIKEKTVTKVPEIHRVICISKMFQAVY